MWSFWLQKLYRIVLVFMLLDSYKHPNIHHCFLMEDLKKTLPNSMNVIPYFMNLRIPDFLSLLIHLFSAYPRHRHWTGTLLNQDHPLIKAANEDQTVRPHFARVYSRISVWQLIGSGRGCHKVRDPDRNICWTWWIWWTSWGTVCWWPYRSKEDLHENGFVIYPTFDPQIWRVVLINTL